MPHSLLSSGCEQVDERLDKLATTRHVGAWDGKDYHMAVIGSVANAFSTWRPARQRTGAFSPSATVIAQS